MMQKIVGDHRKDENGNPAGGRTVGVGINIEWQNGPLSVRDIGGAEVERKEQNGAFVEGVLAAALDRLNFYQQSRFNCRENALAITKIEEALHWLQHRTAKREEQGVEGTHATHVS